MREKIKGSDSFMDTIIKMAEGNPGAARVLADLFKLDPLAMLYLDDMNIRGSQIWIGFKDHCKEDMAVFKECVLKRDMGMIDEINRWVGRNHDDVAVHHGASK